MSGIDESNDILLVVVGFVGMGAGPVLVRVIMLSWME